MAKKRGTPKLDGSGGGTRSNKGRGGCSLADQSEKGRGRSKSRRSSKSSWGSGKW